MDWQEGTDADRGNNCTNSTNWGTDEPIGHWHGVRTDGVGRVLLLELQENNLTGPLPPSMTNLGPLEYLHLENNAALCAPADAYFRVRQVRRWARSVVTEPCPVGVQTGHARKRLDRGIEVYSLRIREVDERWRTVAMFTGAQATAVSRRAAPSPNSVKGNQDGG